MALTSYSLRLKYKKHPSGVEHIEKVNGFWIAGDKHAYQCQKCGAIFQSKNKDCRNIIPTADPQCYSCEQNIKHTNDDLKQVCKCDPIILG